MGTFFLGVLTGAVVEFVVLAIIATNRKGK